MRTSASKSADKNTLLPLELVPLYFLCMLSKTAPFRQTALTDRHFRISISSALEGSSMNGNSSSYHIIFQRVVVRPMKRLPLKTLQHSELILWWNTPHASYCLHSMDSWVLMGSCRRFVEVAFDFDGILLQMTVFSRTENILTAKVCSRDMHILWHTAWCGSQHFLQDGNSDCSCFWWTLRGLWFPKVRTGRRLDTMHLGVVRGQGQQIPQLMLQSHSCLSTVFPGWLLQTHWGWKRLRMLVWAGGCCALFPGRPLLFSFFKSHFTHLLCDAHLLRVVSWDFTDVYEVLWCMTALHEK